MVVVMVTVGVNKTQKGYVMVVVMVTVGVNTTQNPNHKP